MWKSWWQWINLDHCLQIDSLKEVGQDTVPARAKSSHKNDEEAEERVRWRGQISRATKKNNWCVLRTVFKLMVSKKLVEAMLLQEPKHLTRLMKKLKKEYGDMGRLAMLQKRK